MKIKSLLLTAFAASMTFVACDTDKDVQSEDNALKSVALTLPNITKAIGSRALGDAINGDSQVELENFKVFFVNGAEKEVEVPKYDGVDQQVFFSKDDDSWEDIGTDGKVFTYHFLPAETEKVVVVGNIGGDVEYSQLANRTENVLNDSEDGHPLYPLYGDDDLSEKGSAEIEVSTHENVYTATVTLAPRQSRFEIYGFEYVEAIAPAVNSYTSVELQKIALNHYYVSYDFVSKTPSEAGKVFDDPAHAEAWNWIDARTAWCDDLDLTLVPGTPKFVNGTEITDSNEDGDDATDIITYGLAHVAEKANNPELLLMLRGTTADGTSAPLYLRGKFTESDPFVAGKIYRVFFSFTDANLQQPERCVELTVKVANWTVVPVTPNF